MSQTVQITQVREFMMHHLVDVFDTMLSMKAVLLPNAAEPVFSERVSGAVGFGGDTVTGAVYLHLPTPLANQVTAAMLGLPPEEIPGDTEVNDVVGEATNMLTGGLKSLLCDSGADCAMSTPAIIRGTSFAVEPMADVQRECLVFSCGGEHLSIEIHIKFN